MAMAVASDGSYGIPEGVLYSMPVTCAKGEYKIVQGCVARWGAPVRVLPRSLSRARTSPRLPVSDFARAKMDETAKELFEEREQALEFLASA